MDEFWETIPDFPGYDVSDLGRVVNKKTGRFLKATDNGSRNLIVNLQSNRRPVVKQLRWIVAETYLPPPPMLDSVPQHIDRDYTNCRASNLEWMSKSDVHWRIYQERMGECPDEKRVRNKDTDEIYTNIFEAARQLKGYATMIDRSMRNSEFEYKGFQFEYLE